MEIYVHILFGTETQPQGVYTNTTEITLSHTYGKFNCRKHSEPNIDQACLGKVVRRKFRRQDRRTGLSLGVLEIGKVVRKP